MELVRIRLESWRKHASVELRGFAPGVNLVVGPNEAGKSTLREAVHYAFFEPHKGWGEHRKALVPWADSKAAPLVEVEFAHQGRGYLLRKRFSSTRPEARLSSEGKLWQNEEAESELQRLLGTDPPAARARGEVAAELRGIWPLLWMEQDRSHAAFEDALGLTGKVRGRLGDVVGQQVGQLASGALGERVLRLASEKARGFWGQSDKPIGEYARAIEAVAALEAQLAAARQRADAARDAVDQLQKLTDGLPALQGRVTRAQELSAETRRKAEQARELVRQRQQLERDLEHGRELLGEARGKLARLRQIGEELASRAKELAVARSEVAAIEEQLQASRAQREAAEAAQTAATVAVASLRKRLEQAQARGELLRLERELAAAREAEQALRVAEAEAAKPAPTAKQVEQVARLGQRASEARAAHEAALLRIRITARAALPVQLQEARFELAAGETRELPIEGRATLVLGELATVELLPGRSELGQFRDARAAAEQELARALAELGFASVEQARRAHEEAREREGRLKLARQAFALAAPRGLGELDARCQAARARAGEGSESAEDVEPQLKQAERELESAGQGAHSARVALESLVHQHGKRALDVERLTGSLSELQHQQGSAGALQELEGAVGVREASQRELAIRRDQLEQAWREAEGPAADERARAAEKSARDLDAELQQRRLELARLDEKVQSQLNEDLHGDVQGTEAELAAARGKLERMHQEAAAARALLAALEGARDGAMRKLERPVLEAVAPYLGAVFPGARLLVQPESWTFEGLLRRDQPEAFQALSRGAREQLALLVRLGLADVLCGGERLPLFLDDPLTHTDPERHGAMLEALRRAARRLQVVILTCQEVAYDPLCADARHRLDAGPSAAGAGAA